ncbi:hypothetical protein [Chryseolinea sp. T2]|uniref:hypothetical protein n=1 Tax=Chryseolinea sp. T2 TaxID=3129255 RepID=UPI003076B090
MMSYLAPAEHLAVLNAMRTGLKKINDVRKKFQGVYQREGKKISYKGYSETTILLKDIRDEEGKVVTDHLWFTMTKGFEALGTLTSGDIIQFEARVTDYRKGYVNRRIGVNQRSVDYKLSRPTKMRIVGRGSSIQ